MRNRVPEIALTVCLLSACDSKRSVEQIVERGMLRNAGPAELPAPAGPVYTVSSKIFSKDLGLGQPYLIRIVGNTVLVADAAKGPQLHLFDAHTGTLTASVGAQGDGPGDFRGVWGIGLLNNPKEAFVYDLNVFRLTVIDIDSLVSGRLHVLRTLPLKSAVSGIAQLPDGSWFATNGSTTSLFQHFDKTLATITDLRSSTFNIPREDSAFLKTAYESRVCGTNGNRVSVVFHYTSHVSVFDMASTDSKEAKTPVLVTPKFIDNPLVGKRMFKNGNRGVRSAYRDCASDAQSIFALFGGRVIGKYARDRDMFGKFVHEFDWDGNLIRIIQLDHDAISLAIDGSRLITLGLDSLSTPVIRTQILDR